MTIMAIFETSLVVFQRLSRRAAATRPAVLILCVLLTACSLPHRPAPVETPPGKASTVPARQGGGYYKDDGPGAEIPANLDDIPDATPRQEPLHRGANRPYTVLGKNYVPQTLIKPFRQEGVASWYGKKFHGQKTSIGESYDMFAMTAAHPTLPLPSYARVTNPASGKSVVVRVNDRGPFHAGRVIDLSYTAAHKLGYIESGSSKVIIETIVPGADLPPVAPSTAIAATPVPDITATPKAAAELDALALRLQAETAGDDIPQPVPDDIQTAATPGFFLQLGAFANPENAENLKSHLSRDLDDIADPIFIYSDGRLSRLQMGPYPTRASALQTAQKIRDALGNAPTLVIR
jgi:rare lipoprotein A